ncbi:MAG: hypothetical protein A2V79_02465 [Betaproteobacteria bacterium RBG_16_56_24]|nr:MAG: hypothetical protein A2V79_02465 [Betaproteobacteria bacterium RBG_16_56_24]
MIKALPTIQSSPKCKAREKFASIRYADCLLTQLRSAACISTGARSAPILPDQQVWRLRQAAP